jgi:PPM family protein phosphatase
VDEIVSIGEFSQHSGLSPKRLRSYAAAGLLRPVAVDPGSGYRYYRLSQLRAARLIDALRAAGMPISGIGDLLDDPSPARLDAWSRHVQIDAEQRQQALDAARSLLIDEASIAGPSYTRPSGGPQMLSLRVAARSEVGRARDNTRTRSSVGRRWWSLPTAWAATTAARSHRSLRFRC